MMMPRLATIRPFAQKVKAFHRDESGVMAVQVLFFFFMMLLVGGVAVDLMRFEQRRVALVQTMDRATLAAASLENVLTPEDVVNSYFETSGIGETLDSITVDQGMNSRTVRAKATVKSDNYFMSMVDVPYLETQNMSEAEQRVTNVEIAMVLDVSGSMANTPSRITNLKSAGQEFIDTVLDQDTENKISISIVPYNGQVNLGPQLFSKFTVTNTHGTANSFCIDLPTSTYSTTSISRSTGFPQTPHVDSWSSSSTSNSYATMEGPTVSNGLFSNMWCQPNAANFVSVHRNNRVQLKAQIANLVAVGATSIDLGMKWGTMLLDPASRSIVTELSGAGQVPAYFASRPANFGDPETLKVIVLMTDGENFTQERHGDAYRTGQSNIWRSNGDGMMSAYHDRANTTADYWVPHRNSGAGEWRTAPWNSGSGTTRLNWNQVWAVARTNWVAWQLYARALGTDSTTRTAQFNTWKNNFRTYTDTTTMNTRLAQLCTAAKQQGIIVYGIAFEAPAGGEAAIQSCSSTPASTYYFDASGLEIRTAFRLIASNLSQLRLTQ
jgi:Flp pilus assembly protein TadG